MKNVEFFILTKPENIDDDTLTQWHATVHRQTITPCKCLCRCAPALTCVCVHVALCAARHGTGRTARPAKSAVPCCALAKQHLPVPPSSGARAKGWRFQTSARARPCHAWECYRLSVSVATAKSAELQRRREPRAPGGGQADRKAIKSSPRQAAGSNQAEQGGRPAPPAQPRCSAVNAATPASVPCKKQARVLSVRAAYRRLYVHRRLGHDGRPDRDDRRGDGCGGPAGWKELGRRRMEARAPHVVGPRGAPGGSRHSPARSRTEGTPYARRPALCLPAGRGELRPAGREDEATLRRGVHGARAARAWNGSLRACMFCRWCGTAT